jgi:hypothetical protein
MCLVFLLACYRNNLEQIVLNPSPAIVCVVPSSSFPQRLNLFLHLYHGIMLGNLFSNNLSLYAGYVKNQRLPENILTPTTKAADHDVPISGQEVCKLPRISFESTGPVILQSIVQVGVFRD